MQAHTKIYYSYFGYEKEDFVPCELFGVRANDIHHIDCKGMGGDPSGDKDNIDNLMAIARKPHNILGDIEEHMETLQEAHFIFMARETPFVTVDPGNEIFEIFKGTEFEKIVRQFQGSTKYNRNIFY